MIDWYYQQILRTRKWEFLPAPLHSSFCTIIFFEISKSSFHSFGWFQNGGSVRKRYFRHTDSVSKECLWNRKFGRQKNYFEISFFKYIFLLVNSKLIKCVLGNLFQKYFKNHFLRIKQVSSKRMGAERHLGGGRNHHRKLC